VHSAQIAKRHYASGAPTGSRWSIAKNTPNNTKTHKKTLTTPSPSYIKPYYKNKLRKKL
jgi:hypothetical protein